jgi:hypothetical protein
VEDDDAPDFYKKIAACKKNLWVMANSRINQYLGKTWSLCEKLNFKALNCEKIFMATKDDSRDDLRF